MATKNDQVILNLKKEIEIKKKHLAKIEKFNPITNCNLEMDGVRLNLHVANKAQLLYYIAKIKSLEMSLAEVLPEETIMIAGYSSQEWISDLTAKYNHLNVSLEKERLQKLELQLHNLLSIDTKVELEIENLKSQI